MDIYLRQFWNDPRTRYENDTIPYISVTARALSDIWVPDLYFVNEKSGSFHQVTMPNRLVRVYPSGDVVYSLRSVSYTCCISVIFAIARVVSKFVDMGDKSSVLIILGPPIPHFSHPAQI